jgi:nickel transport protein
MKKLLLLLALVFSLLTFPGAAWAHSVETDYWMSAGQLQFASMFGDGAPLEDAPVRIYSPDNPDEPVIEGTTDAAGSFAFTPDPEREGDWTIRIGDMTNHGDILTVPVNEAGVEIDEIVQAPYAAPHWWQRQVGVATAAFGSGLGSVAIFRRRRWF